MSEEQKRLRSKTYRVTSPTGDVVVTHNLAAFCQVNQLNAGRMYQVAKGKEAHHKGWRAVYVAPS